MNDITEQRTMTEAFAPPADSELHKIPVLKDEEELIEMSTDFNLEEFQVVRREFFAHIREPAVTFNNRKFYVNSACLTKFPHTDYVQALINPHTKILALRPCGENRYIVSLRHSSDFYAANVLAEFLGRLSVFLTELLGDHILDEL